MNESTINTRYAKALFKLAKEKNVLSPVQNDMQLVLNAFNEIPDLTKVLEDPVIKTAKKTAIIKVVFKNKMHDISESFLNLIILNKREFYIKGIARFFLNLVKEEMGIKSVLLTTASQLNKKTKEQLSLLIKNTLKSEIELSEVINPDLIGGFILRIDDNQYDSSVRSALKKVHKAFVETNNLK